MTAVERVGEAIAAAEPAWTRRNDMRDDGLYWEVCYHSDPKVVRPVVIKAFRTSDEADSFAEAETKRRQARAAIAALRYPVSDDMARAGIAAIDDGGDLTDSYRAMIDAALAEEG